MKTQSYRPVPASEQSGSTQITFDADNHSWSLVPIRAAFGTGPSHFCGAEGPWNLERVAETFSAQMIRSHYSLVEDAEYGPRHWKSLCLKLDEGLYVMINHHYASVYADSPARAIATVENLEKTFRVPSKPEKPCFHIVKKTSDGIESESVAMESTGLLDDETMSLHYGESFLEWHNTLIEQMMNTVRGLSILDGPPGTGKTSYLRQLMLRLKDSHRFYFIGSANLRLLRDAEFVDFWAGERRLNEGVSLVVILEDAETALMPRSADNREEVSLLLNLTDGILGEFLRLQVVCTINCPLHDLDPALLRPGRLLAHRHFARLTREQAAKLAEKLQKPLPVSEDYSLAEVFSGQLESTKPKRLQGFSPR